MARHPSGWVRFPVNAWVPKEDVPELRKRLAGREPPVSHDVRRLLYDAAGMPLPPGVADDAEG